jgi:hypothetical protein
MLVGLIELTSLWEVAMRNCWALTMLLVFLSVPVLGAPPKSQRIPYPDTYDSIVIPVDSTIRYSGFRNKDGGLVAAFRGRFVVTGTYYYGDNDFNDSGDEKPSDYEFDPQAYIVPDNAKVGRLPHFAIRKADRYVIFIDNPQAFAKVVVSKSAQRRVRCRNCGVATGHIAIWMDKFGASIVCDGPNYEARFLSIYKPPQLAIVPRPDRAC